MDKAKIAKSILDNINIKAKIAKFIIDNKNVIIPILLGLMIAPFFFLFFSVALLCNTFPAKVLDFFGVINCNLEASKTSLSLGNEDAGIRESSCASPLYPNIVNETAYAKTIDSLIPKNSPLHGLGQYFVAGGKKSGINPAFIYSIARKESSFGTAGIATEGTHNSFGRTATENQPHLLINGRRWYKWETWNDSLYTTKSGYEDEPAYIKRRYVDEGKKTIKDIMYTYAPPSENDTEGYIAQLYSWIEELNTKADRAIVCK